MYLFWLLVHSSPIGISETHRRQLSDETLQLRPPDSLSDLSVDSISVGITNDYGLDLHGHVVGSLQLVAIGGYLFQCLSPQMLSMGRKAISDGSRSSSIESDEVWRRGHLADPPDPSDLVSSALLLLLLYLLPIESTERSLRSDQIGRLSGRRSFLVSLSLIWNGMFSRSIK